MFFGFLAWCARLEFLRALDTLLRGTAMTILRKLVASFIMKRRIFSKVNQELINLQRGSGSLLLE